MQYRKPLTIYQPYSHQPIETIRNSSVMRFFVRVMVGKENMNIWIDTRDKRQFYRTAKTGLINLRKFVRFMNEFYYNDQGRKVQSHCALPHLKNNSYNNKWIQKAIQREINYVNDNDLHFRGVKGLSHLQIMRIFRILSHVEAINIFGFYLYV